MFPPATPTGITEKPEPEKPPAPVPHHGLEPNGVPHHHGLGPNPGPNDPLNGKFPNKRGSKAAARCKSALVWENVVNGVIDGVVERIVFWVDVIAGVIDGVVECIVDGVVVRIIDGIVKGCGRIERPWPYAAGAANADNRGTARVSQPRGAVKLKLKRVIGNLLGDE